MLNQPGRLVYRSYPAVGIERRRGEMRIISGSEKRLSANTEMSASVSSIVDLSHQNMELVRLVKLLGLGKVEL
jgi:hypothetical protein